MDKQLPLAWINGKQLPFSQAAVPVWDLGVVAGATVSEMARTYRHTPFRVDHHLNRMMTSCQELGFDCPYSAEELKAAAVDLIQVNSDGLSKSDDLGVVWFATAGINPTYSPHAVGAPSTVCVHTFRIPFALWQPTIEYGVELTIPQAHQLPADSFPTQHKTRNRLHWWLADREAAALRSGSRALLTDCDGHFTETSAACFYAVIDGTVLTARNGVLRSTTRDFVQELCERCSIPFQITDIPAGDVSQFAESFLSSTPCGLLPVSSIDDHTFAPHVGPVLDRLYQEWKAVTGIDTRHQIRSASNE